MRPTLRALILAAGGAAAAMTLTATAPFAMGSDDAAFKAVESQYKKLARNKDDAGNRERRKVLLQCFDFRDLKACRKLLKDAYGDELLPDHRIASVFGLAATGDPKDLEFVLGAFKKERMDGPQIALGQGLGWTDPAHGAAISAYAVGLVPKHKGEPARALLEGLGTLGDAAAYPALAALPMPGEKGDKLQKSEQFERVIALGHCGREKAVELLGRLRTSPDADIRLAAAIGLGRTGGIDQPPAKEALDLLTALVSDTDPRVAEEAALALARTKHEPAVKPLAEAMKTQTLRTREALRAALHAITGREAGYDAEAWQKEGGTGAPPTLPAIEGMTVPSDRVALLFDLSRSMSWNGRFERAQKAVIDALAAVPNEAYFGVIAAGRTPEAMSDKLATGGSAKIAAEEWIRKQLTANGCDMSEALTYVLQTWPSVDTIVLATDSAPWGESPEDSSFEVMQKFRRACRIRRVRLFIVFTCPGGRYEASEVDPEEYKDRKDVLKQFAEMTGGKSAVVE